VKKILYLSYDGMTDPLGQSQVLPYIVGLSSQGYRFTILSFEKKDRFDKERKIIETIATGSAICWKPLFFTRRPPVLSKIYDRWNLKRTVKKLFKEQHFDMIHCRSYVAAEVGLWLKKKYGTKFLFDMRGFWADEKVDSGQWKQNNFFFRRVYKHYKKKEKEFLLHADGIVSLTNAARNELIKKDEYHDLNIDVIPCCADLDHFDYREIKKNFAAGLREQTGIATSSKIITYLGSVGGWYMIGEMFDFYKRLLLKRPEFVMLFLTKDDSGIVRRIAGEKGIPADKMVVLYSGRNELPDYLSLSDCSIFFIRPTYSKISSSPTKHAELMGMGIPVICNTIGDTGQIIEETHSGLLVNEFSYNEYDRIINRMDELLGMSKDHIRQAAFQYFDLEKGVLQYISIYKKIFNLQ
jgi:glycosyltransferase involved in cell wall biosynthesis